MVQLEKVAFVAIAASRGPQNINNALYNSLTLNFLANAAADSCGNIAGGSFHASSVVALMVTVTLVLNIVLQPLLAYVFNGAKYRFRLLLASHMLWGVLIIAGLVVLASVRVDDGAEDKVHVESKLWAFFSILCINSVLFQTEGILHQSYLPELAAGEEGITNMAALSGLASSISGLGLAVCVTVANLFIDFDDVGLGVAAGVGVLLAWSLVGVPGFVALKKLEANMTTEAELTKEEANKEEEEEGKAPLFKPSAEVQALFLSLRKEHRDAGLFLLSFAFYTPAVGNLIVLATTYLQNACGFTSSEIGSLNIVLILSTLPSTYFVQHIQRRVGIKRTLLSSLYVWTLLALITPWAAQGEIVPLEGLLDVPTNASAVVDVLAVNASLTCNGIRPDEDAGDVNAAEVPAGMQLRPTAATTIIVPVFAALWGAGLAVVFTSTTACFAVLIPGGKEHAYFAVQNVASKTVAWAPSAMYAIINEATGSLDVAMFSISIFFLVALPPLLMVDMARSHEAVSPTMGKRRRSSVCDARIVPLAAANQRVPTLKALPELAGDKQQDGDD